MSRPIKCRRIAYLPNVTYFKPAGIPMRELEEVNLSIEEAEAIRLKDLEGLEQEEAAEKMNISRPTFQRILASARRKISDVLLNGKAIRIEGGNFEVDPQFMQGGRCCGREAGWPKCRRNGEENSKIGQIEDSARLSQAGQGD
jgi:uncharacterized protein